MEAFFVGEPFVVGLQDGVSALPQMRTQRVESIAAFFGFGGIAVGAASIAKILFVIFLIVAAVTFLMSLGRRT